MNIHWADICASTGITLGMYQTGHRIYWLPGQLHGPGFVGDMKEFGCPGIRA